DTDEMRALGAGDDVELAARLLAAADVGVLAFGCTSGTLAHGLEFDLELARRLGAATGVPVVTAAGSLVEALERLAVERVALASPYVPDLAARAAAFLEDAGFTVVGTACPEHELTSKGQRDLRPRDAHELALRADGPQAEAIVVSCTDLRSV